MQNKTADKPIVKRNEVMELLAVVQRKLPQYDEGWRLCKRQFIELDPATIQAYC
jgi:hypothetical protein